MDFTEEQKLAILETGKNIIVSAGAGSGKTAVLTARVLRKLNEGVMLDRMLILTFTNAAAKEMKSRIKESIKKDPSLKEQLNIIDSAYIVTFDSFAMSMVKKYHYLLNISPNFSIVDDSLLKLEKDKLIDEIFEEKYKTEDAEFLKLINTFCLKEDKNIKNLILTINDKLDLKIDKEKYLEDYLKEEFIKDKINSYVLEYINLLNKKVDYIFELLKDLKYYVNSDYYDNLNNLFLNLRNAKTYLDYKNNIPSLPPLPKNSGELASKIKECIKKSLDELEELSSYDDLDAIKKSLMETYDYQNAIIDILTLLNEKIKDYKFKNDLYEFTDIAKFLIKILKENEDILLEMKNYFDEIMIDEYQDTSDIQEEFVKLISNNNVYMVGDIKQSIYGFRNANPNIFKEKYEQYKNNLGGIKIDLNKNFRSRDEVLKNINSFFGKVMSFKFGGANYLESHQMNFGNNKYDLFGQFKQNQDLEIYDYNYDNNSIYSRDEIEAFIIANDIKEKIKNNYLVFDKKKDIKRLVNFSDFTILVDRSTSFALYKKIFEYLSVPLTIYKDEKITEEMIVILLKNVLKFIQKVSLKEYDEEFKYLFISLARSPLFEMNDNDIFEFILNDTILNSEIYKKCYDLSLSLDNLSLKDFVDKVLLEFDFEYNFIKIGSLKENQIKIDYLKNLLNNFANIGYTIFDFTKYLENIIEKELDIKLSENKDNLNSVKIMTIHGSKGLEYPICYFPALANNFNKRDLNDLFIYDNKLGIITPYLNNDEIKTTIKKDLLKDTYTEDLVSEKIRLFYVAMTRACEKMIMLLDSSETLDFKLNDYHKNKYNSFKDIVLSVKKEFEKNIKYIDTNNLNLTKKYNLIKNNDYLKYIDDNNEIIEVKELNIQNNLKSSESFSKKTSKLITKEEKQNMEFGLKMHEILETLDLKNPDLGNLDSFSKNKVEQFLKLDLLKNIKASSIYQEYEFMYEDNNTLYHGIIDLMLVYKDHVDIIDYKLKNIDDDAYLKQLTGYKNYIEAKLNKETNIYLYSITDGIIKRLND